MAIERRDILRFLAVAPAASLLSPFARAAASELFAAALREADGSYGAAIFSLDTGIITKIDLPGRGHSCVRRPGSAECLVFARRPGTFAISFDYARKAAPVAFASAVGRHFYGHGAFSQDGRLLYSTENDYENNRGVIGVRDATDGYRRIGEFPSAGTGPHDIAMLCDGRTLVVANGGIETHPEFGREPLNLATMAPNLAYIDARNGDLFERHKLPAHMHQVSIRHLSAVKAGSVIFGCQNKGPRNRQPRLVGFHKRGDALVLAEIPQTASARLKGYVASVAADSSGDIAVATSPRGGVVLYFDVPGRKFLGLRKFTDASGAAGRANGSGFVLTSGNGQAALSQSQGSLSVSENAVAWDNHVTAIR